MQSSVRYITRDLEHFPLIVTIRPSCPGSSRRLALYAGSRILLHGPLLSILKSI